MTLPSIVPSIVSSARETVRPRTCRPGPALTVLVLLAGLLGLLVAGPNATVAPARADPLGGAQSRVASLNREVGVITTRLAEGTRQLAVDQARHRTVRRLLAATGRRIGAAQADADAGSAVVGQIAARLYRSPPAGLLLLSLSARPGDAGDALAVQASLTQLADQQRGRVRRAVAARVELRAEQRVVAELAAEAAALAERSAAERRRLVALARDTANRLEAAQQALLQARRAEAARLAAQRLAAPDRGRQGAPFSGGPGCSGASTAGQANGNLDPAVLCPVWNAAGERLRGDAARAFNAMSQAKAASTGAGLCVTDAYRPYREQVIVYAQTPAMTAIPGTSNHGWGQAVDLCGGAERYDGAAYRWLKTHAGRFGWHHPAWAEPGQRQEEPWHWEFGT